MDEYRVTVSAGKEFTIAASAMSYVNLLLNAPAYQNDTNAQYAMTSLYRYYAAADAFRNAS